MNPKLFSVIGLACGVLILIFAFIVGFEYDWGWIGLSAGVGLIATNFSGLQVIKDKFKK